MARPQKPPRLELRKGVYYLSDTARGVRQSLQTKDEETAERLLKEYVANLGSFLPAPTKEPLIRDILEGYRLTRLDTQRERARIKASTVCSKTGVTDPVEIERLKQEAVAKVKDTGSLEYQIQALNRHVGDLRLTAISSAMARSYRDQRRAEGKRAGNGRVAESVADGTIRRELASLKLALTWGNKDNREFWFGQRNKPEFDYPVQQVGGRQEYLDHAQVEEMLRQCLEPHLRLYVLLAVQTGARKSAILELRWEDVDFERRVIDFGLVDHKKRRPIVAMTDLVYEELVKAYSCRAVGSTHVIEYHGRPVGNIKKGFRDLVKRCGMDPEVITPHVLKHTYISWLCAFTNLPVDEIAAYANTTAKTIEGHYNHLIRDRAAAVKEAVRLDYRNDGFGPSQVGDIDANALRVVVEQQTGQISRRPTRHEMETKGLITGNTRRIKPKFKVVA